MCFHFDKCLSYPLKLSHQEKFEIVSSRAFRELETTYHIGLFERERANNVVLLDADPATVAAGRTQRKRKVRSARQVCEAKSDGSVLDPARA